MISLKSESLAIYKDTKFIIKELDFFINSTGGKITSLFLAIPETYTLEEPKEYPWD
jgi:hypothetical protein